MANIKTHGKKISQKTAADRLLQIFNSEKTFEITFYTPGEVPLSLIFAEPAAKKILKEFTQNLCEYLIAGHHSGK